MNSQQILTAYQEAADLTRLMLAAARAGDWDQVIEHEKACAAIISPLIGENTEAGGAAARHARQKRARQRAYRGQHLAGDSIGHFVGQHLFADQFKMVVNVL